MADTGTFVENQGRQVAAGEFAVAAGRKCADLKCSDVRVLDVSGKSSICDFLVIATGTSDRQLRTVVDDLYEVADEMGQDHMGGRQRKSGIGGETRWVAIDFIDVVVHLFDAEARLFYDLDNLYDAARAVEWREADGA